MKVLVFEFICGGGLAHQALPPSLAAEGRLMLQAVLDDLACLSGIEIVVMIDDRLHFPIDGTIERVPVTFQDDYRQILNAYLGCCDVFLPIAPESGDALLQICKMAESTGKAALLSSPDAIALCGNKLATIEILSRQGIPTVETQALSTEMPWSELVIKPIDGVGCEGSAVIIDPVAYRQAIESLSPAQWIVQPFMTGSSMSLSCLFQQGQGWLLSVNRQNVDCRQGRFKLSGCDVGVDSPHDYAALVSRIATAIPGLWGYVGVDVIENRDTGYRVLEINPRLTTSYAGIRDATGINPVEQMLRMLQGAEPRCPSGGHKRVQVSIDRFAGAWS